MSPWQHPGLVSEVTVLNVVRHTLNIGVCERHLISGSELSVVQVKVNYLCATHSQDVHTKPLVY